MGAFSRRVAAIADDLVVGASHLGSNKAVTAVQGRYSAVVNSERAAAAWMHAKSVSKAVASDLGSVKGAAISGGGLIAGGAVGYATADDGHKFRGAMLGSAIGGLAGIGTVAGLNPTVQTAARTGWGAASSYGRNGWAAGKKWVNEAPTRQAYRKYAADVAEEAAGLPGGIGL